MSKGRDRTVSRRPDGKYANKRNDATRASGLHDTQQEAWDAARQMLRSQGGGELTVLGVRGPNKGKIVSKDTIEPGHDPSSIRDTEH